MNNVLICWPVLRVMWIKNIFKILAGKSRLKYELRSYQEMVVIPMKQMNEDNQQLVWLKNKVIKQEKRSKAIEETFGVVTQKLRETMEENRIVRLRTKIQHQENKEEVVSLFYYCTSITFLLFSKFSFKVYKSSFMRHNVVRQWKSYYFSACLGT